MKLTINNSSTNPAAVKQIERAARAFQLRKGGLDYQAIADTILEEWEEAGIGHELPPSWGKRYAHKDVTEMMQEHRTTIQESLTDVLELEVARLDALLTAVWDKAVAGKYEAIDRVLKIMDRRAKHLGLDKASEESDWRNEIVMLLKAGRVTMVQIREELGDDLAQQIIEYSGNTAVGSRQAKGAIEIGPIG